MTAMSERMEKKRKEEERLDRKRKAKKRNQFDDVKDLRNKFGNKKVHRFMQFNKDQCGKYLQYKKNGKEDGKMPDNGHVAFFGWIALRPHHLLMMAILPTLMLTPTLTIMTTLTKARWMPMSMPESCLV
jgi:hypothetical protein